MFIEIIAAYLATLGFGIIFNIKGKKLQFAAIGGSLGWFVYKLSLNVTGENITSLFLAAICFSIYAEILARILKTPVTTFVVCALITLVPGGGMYYTMSEAITGNVNKSLQIGLETLAQAGALALGIAVISTVMKIKKKI